MTTPETVPLYRRVRPANGNNAIVNAALALTFQQPADKRSIDKFAALSASFFDWGYIGQPVQTIAIEMRVGEQMKMAPEPRVTGYTYQRNSSYAGRGMSFREITLRDAELILVVDRYTRWTEVWAEALEVYQSVLGALDPSLRIENAVLEYLDRFDFVGAGHRFPVADIVKTCPYLPSSALAAEGDWHNQHAFYSNLTDADFARRLNSVNVHVSSPEGGKPALQIMCQHRYVDPLRPMEGVSRLDAVISVMDHAHRVSKEVMNSLLTDEAKILISLNEASS